VNGGLRVLFLAFLVAVVAVGCSGEDGAAGRGSEGGAGGAARTTAGDELGHQAYQSATRLVVPAAEGHVYDRAARVLAGLAEDRLGASIFVQQRPGEGGLAAWRDVADEEPDGHQLAYVTEGILAPPGGKGFGADDLEMVARTDAGTAVLAVRGDLEAESFQNFDPKDLGEFLEAAGDDPGLVEVADAGEGTVYRAGTLALEREAGVDLSPKHFAGKTPTEALYDGDVEAVLVPADEAMTDMLAGELEALAVLDEDRLRDLPEVPTAKELGYDVSVPVFGGIAAPAETPRRVVDELGRAFVAASSSGPFDKALAGTGREPMPLGPGEFTEYVEAGS
jgi:tripartite-type tricarboxylate transporter receptor subunit TctC